MSSIPCIFAFFLAAAPNQIIAHNFSMHISPDSGQSSNPGVPRTEGTFSNLAPNPGDHEDEKRQAEIRAGYPNGYTPPPLDKTDEQIDREYRNSFVGRTLKDGLERMQTFVVRREEVREQIAHMDQPEIREKYVDLATQTMKDARTLLQQETWRDEFADGPVIVSLAESLLDFAVNVTPGIGWGRDIYEAITGTDLLSGAEMSVSNRAIAIIGVATFGAGKIAVKGFWAIEKSLRAISRIVRGPTAKFSISAAKKALVSAKKSGFDLRTLNHSKKTDQVLMETLSGKGNLTSKFTLKADEALEAGIKWVGPGYKEIGKSGSGVFRSKDGLRQFRMDKNSIVGNHAPNKPHVHFETYQSGAKKFEANNHVPFTD